MSRRRRSAPGLAGATPASAGERRRKILYAIAGAGVVALIAVLLFVTLGGGTNDKKVASLMTAAGCSFKT